jgi:hypothetical protein
MDSLKKKTSLSLRAIYKRIQRKKESLGFTVTLEQAAALLASECGIDISKILEPKALAELRALQVQKPQVIEKAVSKKTIAQPKILNFASGLQMQDPFLASGVLREAEKMKEVYPIIYVFENSVRNVISLVLTKKYGLDWWDKRVAKPVRDRIQGRIDDETNNPWHGKRGVAPIFYADIKDLQSIIKNNWGDFQSLFPNQNWIEARIGEIERSRNIVAHNNPLCERDIKRVRIYFEDWETQIGAVKDKI